jgi:hypothetical protein
MNFNKITYFETSDYSAFNNLPFNRDVDKAHVKKLVESMKKNGFKGVIQIIKTKFIDGLEKFYVVDGQHRLAAAMQLNIPIKFELTELASKMATAEFIAELNTSAKSWGTTNFLEVWSAMEIEEYIKLARTQKETGFQITPLLECYLETSNQTDYRKGKMKFPNEENSDKIVRQMVDLNQYLPSKAFCRRAIVRVMRNPKYNHKKMKKAIANFVQLTGGFTENERALKSELDKLVQNNC